MTFVDTNRQLFVFQDATGAMAVNTRGQNFSVKPGQQVALEGTNAAPCLASFPDYPYRPSGRDLQSSFEAPSNWGDYHLTRMRALLHPPVTGDYTFWIASDNSSELWLSPDADPGKVRRIGFVRQWVNPHEWLREPGQQSASIRLRADQSYYIEAFQEQLTLDDHLSVAWQGPSLERAVVEGRYLTPWPTGPEQGVSGTNGALRDYWTNYFAGNLVGISGPKPFESSLSAEGMHLAILGAEGMPEAKRILLSQPLPPEDNYRWIETEGTIDFAGRNGESALIELSDGPAQAQVHFSNPKGSWPTNFQEWLVRVQGVCEGVRDPNGVLMPKLIWAATDASLSFIQPATNQDSFRRAVVNSLTPTNPSPASGGFYITYGIVTFNDRVFGKDYFFVQGDTAVISISQSDRHWGKRLQVGQWIEVGGDLLPGRYVPTLRPLDLRPLDWRPLPRPLEGSLVGYKDGRWTESEGVVRASNPDGTMLLMAKRGPILVWVGHTPTNVVHQYVDSVLRVRGVMSLTLLESPLLLVPSRNFLQVEEPPPQDPFGLPPCSIASLETANPDPQLVHRVKISGVVTHANHGALFVQDQRAGARVQTLAEPFVQIGAPVEVIGFPKPDSAVPTLTEALLRPGSQGLALSPQAVNVNQIIAGGHSGTLITLKANVLGQTSRDHDQVLELQQEQRVFEAMLTTNQGDLPVLQAGSRIQITGVCDTEPATLAGDTSARPPKASVGTLRILLRSPGDVVLLSGPPWWTWRKAATLVGVLLTMMAGAAFRIHLLRRRLERQQAAQLAFSRQILQSQESERRRIAVNLHDSLGQNLLVIKNQARLALQPNKDESVLRQRLNEISGVASEALEEVRQITHGLRPYQLDRLGLTHAIRAAIDNVSVNSAVLFASDVEDLDGLFDKESEIHLYRILQETLSNIVKHSGATEATVVIKRRPGAVAFSIRDNGHGFEASLLSSGLKNAGFGLSGISERTRILGGTLHVDSRPGEGAIVRIEIPINESPNEKRIEAADRR